VNDIDRQISIDSLALYCCGEENKLEIVMRLKAQAVAWIFCSFELVGGKVDNFPLSKDLHEAS
jgi:hypothetical protein